MIRLSRSAGMASALALALAPVAAESAAPVPPICPDAATVQAARIVEFQTMMMGVAVRCRLVGVPILEHLDDMNSARRMMFTDANDRVATFLRSLKTRPLPTIAPLTGGANPAPQPTPSASGKAIAGKAGAKTAGNAAAPLAIAATGARKVPARTASAAPAPAKPPAAKVSRRTDPYDRYLTMIGNQYGAGITTLQRCKAFDAIVIAVSDRTNPNRLLTMVSSSLVQATLLEAIVKCPSGK
ncbi:hypothetical protein [Novosphingobium sp.]|uniref:hypothetical protein n=1 Tax=Novosphingobium sp. TaxID=1874826 RepID=UPI003BAAF400